MRIGIDCRLPYYRLGGISQYVLGLLPALAELDTENTYLIFHQGRDGRSYLPPAPNFYRRHLWTPCHHRLERWTVAAELLPHHLDVCHSPDFIPPAFATGRPVITIHDLSFLFYPQFLTAESRRYYPGQIAWAVQRAAHILADSQHTRRDLIEQLSVPQEKVTAVPLAANPLYEQSWAAPIVEATLQFFNLPRGFLFFVGTLEPRKNLPTLLKAYQSLFLEGVMDVPLVVVGSRGWLYEESLAAIGELGLHRHVHLLDKVSDEQLAHLYTAAALLAMPSHYEGFGLPVLEAMHCGCPVIASNRASLPEVVGTAGLLLDPNDSEAWAAAMAQVLTNSQLRQQLVEAGYSQASQFTWQKTAAATLRVYLDTTLPD
ncbi:MAG: glycosyltransferase family 1 protein [Chloroflexota bacterium]